MHASSKTAAKKPPIHISDADYDYIADLAIRLERPNPVLSGLLMEEINRAKVHSPKRLPKDVVSLGSAVEFVDDSSGARHNIKLVRPTEADVDAGRLSIMTQIGAGLIGMREGHAIDWPRPDGSPRTLRILQVVQPEEEQRDPRVSPRD